MKQRQMNIQNDIAVEDVTPILCERVSILIDVCDTEGTIYCVAIGNAEFG